ncbi:MAG: 6-pyruvoyl tetrahydropterin synthase family protein [Phycisphaera sp.]|nr:MAG: 6-pyruvoyl tetrahydropterin synthase family protein [Phycisphaera sp.]
MFEITAQTRFNAQHAILIKGEREPLHGHDWLVRATIAGPTLDGEGLLCDFHAVEAALRLIVDPWNHDNLNHSEAFRGRKIEPTAENVAMVIATELASALGETLPTDARVARVSVTEAPDCVATYIPPTAADPKAGARTP